MDVRSAGVLEAVSRDRLMESLAAIAREVRDSGSAEEMRAVEYMRAELDSAGLETELITHDAYISIPGPSKLVDQQGNEWPCITHSFAAPTDGLDGRLIDCGAADDSALSASTGHIALIDGLAMPALTQRVEQAGAVAQVYINDRLTHELIVSNVWGSPGTAALASYRHTPVVSVTQDVGAHLRKELSAGRDQLRLHTALDTRWRSTPILLGRLNGRNPEYVMFSGHVDSWHLGAMDNASANSTMLEVARVVGERRHELERGLMIAVWSGHSHGRYAGSAWYADQFGFEMAGHCIAHVNIDSVGAKGATLLSHGVTTAGLRDVGADAIEVVAGESFEGRRVGRSGDQSFLLYGIPSLWMTVSEQPPSDDPIGADFARMVGSGHSGGLGWWWHTVEDTIDKIDPEFLLRDAQIYCSAIWTLLTERVTCVDAAEEVRDFATHLGALAAAAIPVFDLAHESDSASRLQQLCADLKKLAKTRRDTLTDSEVAAYNRATVEVVRLVLPLNYTSADPMMPDSAAGVPPIPLLHPIHRLLEIDPQMDEAHALRVDLTRARSRVRSALREALKVAEGALRQLGSPAIQ